jgi:hypothetical protein
LIRNKYFKFNTLPNLTRALYISMQGIGN